LAYRKLPDRTYARHKNPPVRLSPGRASSRLQPARMEIPEGIYTFLRIARNTVTLLIAKQMTAPSAATSINAAVR